MLRRHTRENIVEPPTQSRLDKLISSVSPTWGLRRMQARAHLGLVMRHYEGGGMSRRTEGWRTPGSDANEAARGTLPMLRNRCRDLYRNNAWAGRGIRAMTQSVVGTGIMLRAADPEGRPIEKSEAKEMMAMWARWALTKEIDADGRCNLYGIQRIVQRTLMQSGEVLIRRRWRRASDGLTVPLQLQVLEGDYLDRTKDGEGRAEGTGERVYRVNGIEFDALGRRRGYWMYRDHPGSGFLRDVRSVFIHADEILHIYRVDRPGQVVGIPPLAPVIILARDHDELQDAYLMRQKIAAMFAGFIHDQTNADVFGNADRKNPDGTTGDTFEPGMLHTLPLGQEITFPQTPTVEGYADYNACLLRAIAMSLDVTYEQLTGDLRNTNFASARIGLIPHFEAADDWQWDVLIPTGLDEVFAWFVLALELIGKKAPADVVPRWTPPKRRMIDPTSETAASIRQVRGGLQSYSEALREQGYERDEVLNELADDMRAIRAHGLMLETDAAADSNRKPPDTSGDKNNGGRTPNKTKVVPAKE